ncbi:MAG: hypothetical protein COB85_04730 [Bacteroidetes bacterium]|nr:MAG: hypothetical protein COB85_04730 [Bacteroidota bacterium]
MSQIPDIKEGAYKNSMYFEKGILLLRAEFRFKETGFGLDRTFYRVSTKDKIAKSQLKKHIIWGIYQNSVLYLNAMRLGMKKHYVVVQEIGKYCYLIGRPIKDISQQAAIGNAAFYGGLIGAGITNAAINAKINDQIHYLVNLDTGVPHLVTQPYLEHILAADEKLLTKYKDELNPHYLSVMLNYVGLLNAMYDN